MTTPKLVSSRVSVWSYKPWWCKPWSIGLTGISLVLGSWVLSDRLWVTALVAIPILIWMGYFLVVYPRLFRQAIDQSLGSATDNPPQQNDPHP